MKTETEVEEIRDNIRNVMSSFYCSSVIDTMSVEQAKEILMPYLDDFIYLYENHHVEYEDDWRSGEETYGYENQESIMGNLFHISDRWGCAFRLRWMIDLLTDDYYVFKDMDL
jgi:hypothetical protein